MKSGIVKIVLSSVALVILLVFTILLVCGVFAPKGNVPKGPSIDYTAGDPKTMYGEDALFDEAIGWADSDPSVIQLADGTRYLYYTSNVTMWDNDYAIVCRKGVKDSDGEYVYSDRKTVLETSASGWDKGYIASADVVKGSFSYGGKNYSYLMAYQANEGGYDDASCFMIGFAVSESPDEGWVKVGNSPVLKNDATLRKDDILGYYAPSLVSNDRSGNVKLFYTYGDAYGHFQYFSDINCSNLDNIPAFGSILLSGTGLSTGESIVMFPNADFIYDAEKERYYVVKDFSPSANTLPRKAYQVEIAFVKKVNLYTADYGSVFNSLKIVNGFTVMGDKDGWERIYSATLVGNEYGYRIDSDSLEIMYTACDIPENEPEDYPWTPSIHGYLFQEIYRGN